MNHYKINLLSTLFQKHPKTVLCLILCILTIAAYWPVRNYPFIDFDDGPYIYKNNHVTSGLNIQNILWAFSFSDAAADKDINYWHPMTWISHMGDVQLFGVDPHMHHVCNLFFHTLNTILLFLVFSLMTGDIWKCFFMAALFALHPLNIESVAWISERKNLLSTTFWMITLLAYIFYAKRPSISKYLLVFLALGFGLLAKPILSVLPCALLLLDYWPMKRIKWAYGFNNSDNSDSSILSKTTFLKASSVRLILEKIPLLILSVAAILVSMIMLQGKSKVINSAMLPLSLRIENAFVSYVVYLYKMIWPVDLAIFYPFPDAIPAWQTIGAIIFLIIVTTFAMIRSKTKPYLIIGWLWFLGVLFPAIGLVQGGLWPSLADRWAYVPLIGIFIILAWGIPDLLSNSRYRKAILSVAAVSVMIILFCVTRIQLAYWTSTYTLFNRTLAVTENNCFAYNVVGKELALKGDYQTAKKYFLTILKIKPHDADAMIGMGQLAFQNKNYDNALDYYQKALLARPNDTIILNMIGESYLKSGKLDSALDYYSNALKLQPSDPELYNKRGVVFFSKKMFEQAQKDFETAVKLKPNFDEAYYNLGLVAVKQGEINNALNNYKKAISINPDYGDAHKSLADILFAQGDLDDAFEQYSEALRINPNDATTHYNIGVIFFQQQRIKEAGDHFYKAVQIDNTYKKAQIALRMTRHILEGSGDFTTGP